MPTAGALTADGRTPRQVLRDLREREERKYWRAIVNAARAFRHDEVTYLTLQRTVDVLEEWERRGRPVSA